VSLDYTIRLYELLPDGGLEALGGGPISQYGGACPNVGDTIARLHPLDETFQFYNVQRRMFIDSADGDEGWAILIRAVDASALMSAVAAEWLDETIFWRDVEKKESWEYRSAQREKHRPHHRLDAREQQILRFMIANPGKTAVDEIPRAGEKTMEKLLEVGVVRAGGKDDRGHRKWHVSDDGLAEISRIEAYENWKPD
jgi:hypothetical protein